LSRFRGPDQILSGRAKEVYPDNSEEDSIKFAEGIKSIEDEGDEK